MLPTSVQLVMFDMAGTTVNDKIEGYPLMIISMMRAFANHGIELAPNLINKHRGKQKSEAVRILLEENAELPLHDDECIVNAVYGDFLRELESNLSSISEIHGTTKIFRQLKSKGICVGIGSGFPAQIVEAIVSQLGWQNNKLLDYVGSAEQVGVGRPDPKGIYDAMQTLGITEKRRVIKIGDTVVDIQEGRNAGVWTVAVLTGSQTKTELRAAEPDYILSSIQELPRLFDW